jgi:hypothetical protein
MQASKELVINFNPVNEDQQELTLLDKIKLAITAAQSDYSNFHLHDYPEKLNRGCMQGSFCFMAHGNAGIKQAREFDRSINAAVSLEEVIGLIDKFLNAATTHHSAHSFSSYMMDALIKKIMPDVNISPEEKSKCYSSSARKSVLDQLRMLESMCAQQIHGILMPNYKIKLNENIVPVDRSFTKDTLINRCPKRYFENVDNQTGTLLVVGDIWPGIFSLLDLNALLCMMFSCKKAALLANEDKTREQLFMLKAPKLNAIYTQKGIEKFFGLPSSVGVDVGKYYHSQKSDSYFRRNI